jgi:hypothetical protein
VRALSHAIVTGPMPTRRAGGVSDMSRKVGTEWAVRPKACVFATVLGRHRLE